MFAVYLTDSTLTVHADTQLARPASTLPPGPPTESVLAAAAPAKPAKPSMPTAALRGLATWYGGVFEGQHTANGEIFDAEAMTAAHKTLPFGTIVRVINLRTHKSIVVRVNDRGILPNNHVIDLSYAAGEKLNIIHSGVAPVKLEILALGPLPQTQKP
jgi:rare lipoprotein A